MRTGLEPVASRLPVETNQRIWQVVTMIPRGRVATYGDIARHAGMPGAARRVGYALRGLPEDTGIPWHRVINAQGKIAVPEGSVSRVTQRQRLEQEGVTFTTGTRISLRQYRWLPGDAGQRPDRAKDIEKH